MKIIKMLYGKDKKSDNDMGLNQHDVINDAERVINKDAYL